MARAAERAAAVPYPLHVHSNVHWHMIAFAVERWGHIGRLAGWACSGGHALRGSEGRWHGCDRLRHWDWACEYRRAIVVAPVVDDVGEGGEDTSFLDPSIQTWWEVCMGVFCAIREVLVVGKKSGKSW